MADHDFGLCVRLFLGNGQLLPRVSTGCLETAQRQEIVQHIARCKTRNCFHTSVFVRIKESEMVLMSVVRLKGLVWKRIGAICEKFEFGARVYLGSDFNLFNL